MKTLNVGCGSDVWGDVKVDVAKEYLNQHFKPTVLADAHYLPFRDKCFEVTKCSHVLEHLQFPYKALDEIVRVTKKKIILKFPTEHDTYPFIIPWLFPLPDFKKIRDQMNRRKKGHHLWIINSARIVKSLERQGWKVNVSKGEVSVFGMLQCGRKAKFFSWLTKRTLIAFEYVVEAEYK